jgi:cardiolipin synthase
MLTSLPNLLTLGRIAAIPLIVALLYIEGATARWLALALFAAACITDYYDGLLARRRNEISALGRFLDPIADKLLVVAILVMLIATGQVAGLTVLAALAILGREILVSGLREYLGGLQVAVPVSGLAKWKTMVQMVALAVLLIAPALPGLPLALLAGEVLLWLAAALTVVTGWSYLSHGLRHMTSP